MHGKWKVTPRHEVGSCSASRGRGPKFSSRKRWPRGDSMPLQILWRGNCLRSRMMVSSPASTRRVAAAAAERLAPTMMTSADRMWRPTLCIFTVNKIGRVYDRYIGDLRERGHVLDVFNDYAVDSTPLHYPACVG